MKTRAIVGSGRQILGRLVALLGSFLGFGGRQIPAAANLRYYVPPPERRDLEQRLRPKKCRGHHRRHRREHRAMQKRSRRINWGLLQGNARA